MKGNVAPKKELVHCDPLPVAVEEVAQRFEFSAERTRRLFHVVLKEEGSSYKEALTCVAQEDRDRLFSLIKSHAGHFSRFDVGRAFRGRVRSLNRHCDGCSNGACKSRTNYTKKMLTEHHQETGEYISPRAAKVKLPIIQAEQLEDKPRRSVNNDTDVENPMLSVYA